MITRATYRRTIDAPVERVFDVLTSHERYSSFTPLHRVSLERVGSEDRNGVGAVRALHPLPGPFPAVREEVLTFERPRGFSYTLVTPLPLRHHRGAVSLEECDGRTRISYTMEVDPLVPLPRLLLRTALKVGAGVIAIVVGREAERQERAEPTTNGGITG